MFEAEDGAVGGEDGGNERGAVAAGAEPVLPESGKVLVLRGTPASAIYAMAVRSVLETGRPAIFVDGGCQVDPYRVAEVAKALGCSRRDIDGLLRGILVARAFTAHQLEALVVERLEPEARRARAGFAAVLDIDALFMDEQLDVYEARIMKARCLRRLRALAKECRLPVVVTEGSDRKHSRWGF